jgi:arylsulfatase A-like enzyme
MVNAGAQLMPEINERVTLLNELQSSANGDWAKGKRKDVFTYRQAFEYLTSQRPKILYIALGDADNHAHKGNYDLYLGNLQQVDKALQHLWNWLQNDPQYRDKTTLIITTDHGRGDDEIDSWKDHGNKFDKNGALVGLTAGDEYVWMAAIGPDTPAQGAIKHEPIELRQIAPTIAALVNVQLTTDHQNYTMPPAIKQMIGNARE